MTTAPASMPQDRLAFDFASTRRIDQDGHLHVTQSAVSKANVCGYLGSEIPDAEKLGLDPKRTYQLYRDPDEIEKAVTTLNGKPLLATIHKPQTAEDYTPELVVGSLNNATWGAPYLRADLTVWDQAAIDGIDDDTQREISCCYRYRAVMEPGTAPDGARFDGRMTDILFNHATIVVEGRAGPDCFVGDSALIRNQEITMAVAKVSRQALLASGALAAYIRPKMAADTKLDLRPVMKGVTSKNWKSEKSKIADRLKVATEGKLAADADIDDVVEMLDKLETVAEEMPDAAITTASPTDTADDADDEVVARLKAALKAGGMSDEDIEKVCAGVTATPPAAADADDDDDKVTKSAMDAAIADATRVATDAAIKRQRDIAEAERFVRPWAGELVGAFDSAEGVHAAALTVLGIKTDGVHPSALRHILEAQPKPGATMSRTIVAADSVSVASRESRFGANATRLAS